MITATDLHHLQFPWAEAARSPAYWQQGGKERGGKGNCILDLSDVALYAEGLLAVLIPDEADDACAVQLRKVKEIFGDRAYMALTLRRRPNDQLRLHELNTLAIRHKVRPVVTNDVLFHEPGRRQLQDVVTCIRHRTTIDQAGFLRERHADRFLKPPEEMHRLFSRYPERSPVPARLSIAVAST